MKNRSCNKLDDENKLEKITEMQQNLLGYYNLNVRKNLDLQKNFRLGPKNNKS